MSIPEKLMSLETFKQEGFLLELNRQFLHPLGLSMSFIFDDLGSVKDIEIWDYRDDPEGILFSEEFLNDFRTIFILEEIKELRDSKVEARKAYFCDEKGVQQRKIL